MAPHLSLPQLAAVPQRQYAQLGGVHASLGWPIRLIAGTALTLILGLAVLVLFGLPAPGHITSLVVFAIGVAIISVLVVGIRVAAQWEKGVVLRFGRFAGLCGPGLLYIIPGVEHALFVDRRLLTLDIAGQTAITKDNVPVQIDGALFFQVHDPARVVAVDVHPGPEPQPATHPSQRPSRRPNHRTSGRAATRHGRQPNLCHAF
jgi:hypothetical protein